MALRKSIVNRFTIVYIVVAMLFFVAVLQMLRIMTIDRGDWLAEAAKLERKDRVEIPERGNMYDADGNLITATIPYYSLYMDLGVDAYKTSKGQKRYQENIDSLCICLSRKFGDKSAQEYRRMIDAAFVKGNRRLKLYPKKVSYIDLMEIKTFPLFRAGKYKSGFFAEEFSNRENLYGSLANRTIGDIYGSGGRGQYGHCKVRFEPMDANGEELFKFDSEVVGGAIPKEYIPAVGEGIEEATKAGILAGFPVVGIHATVYDGSYHEVDSNEMAFHIAGSMAFKDAMQKASAVLLEPIMKVEVTMPEEYMGDVIGSLNAKRGQIQSMDDLGGGKIVRALVPLAEMFGYSTELRSSTQGRGNYSMFFEKYEPAPKNIQDKVINAKKGN